MLARMIHEYSAARMTMRSRFCLAVAMAALVAFAGSAFAGGNAAKGKAAFAARCASCHQEGLGAGPFVGPELNGIVGRDAASVPNYTRYSEGLKKLRESGFVWTEENMDKWIADPKAILPDSPMAVAFPGIPDANERAAIIAYLKTQ
jgi:cytochrome c